MEVQATFVATFEDGKVETVAASAPEAQRLKRVALVWTDPVDLDLHAFEYGAPIGGENHVWSGAPRDFRSVRRTGGGFLQRFEPAADGLPSIEVYSFWESRRSRSGVVSLALDFADRGDLPAGAFCEQGDLAAPSYRVVRSLKGDVKRGRQGGLAPVSCGRELATRARYLRQAVEDLRISNN
jgi:hypothetical protein